jgi:NACHT domain
MSDMDIDFQKIRAYEGQKSKGFEELCVQLFPLLIIEKLLRIDRIEGSGGDGGVEAIATVSNQKLVGIQAKYWPKLEKSQWAQIDKSVKSATQNHPDLSCYIICTPLDRTPAQLQKWNAKVTEWQLSNPTISFEWCGKSELVRLLIRTENDPLRTYWFGHPSFTLGWVTKQTEAAIEQLAHRYTPELHQETFTEQALSAFALTNSYIKQHVKKCSNLVIAWRKMLEKIKWKRTEETWTSSVQDLESVLDGFVKTLFDGDISKQNQQLLTALTALLESADKLLEIAFPFNMNGTKYRDVSSQARRNAELTLSKAQSLTNNFLDDLKKYFERDQASLCLLSGQAGTGKSHILAKLAQTILKENRACLLLVGERFSSGRSLSVQIPEQLDWLGDMHSLLSCLSEFAKIKGRTSLILIDAINESSDRSVWRRDLISLEALVNKFPNVKLLLSCRTDCISNCFSSSFIDKNFLTVEHRGFDMSFDAVIRAYFLGHNVRSHQFPTHNREFQNPLFLKTLCEAYKDRDIPTGAFSFIKVLDAWESRIAENIEIAIDCPFDTLKQTVAAIVLAMAHNQSPLTKSEVQKICLDHFSNDTASGSLYPRLNSEGLLQEVEHYESETTVRLQYERFSDIRITQAQIKSIRTKDEWWLQWQTQLLPKMLSKYPRHAHSDFDDLRLDWYAEPKLFALALLLPDVLEIELSECPVAQAVNEDWLKSEAQATLCGAWLDALAWRTVTEKQAPRVIQHFRHWANNGIDPHEIWRRLFQYAAISKHPLNADFLNLILKKWSLPTRDLNWTIPLAREDFSDPREGVLSAFFHWADAAPKSLSSEQTRLSCIVLIWLTSTTNPRMRNKATDIAIRLLVASQSGQICLQLFDIFWGVNDPYVKERLLAVMAGVVPHLNTDGCTAVASYVWGNFWHQPMVEPHLLQRDYAGFIVKHACHLGLMPKEHAVQIDNLPRQNKPIVWTEDQVKIYETNEDYSAIKWSLRPEEMGGYGDFGRYVMGNAVHHFVDNLSEIPKPSGLFRGNGEHDARTARRYIWQRIIELGWDPKLHKNFEQNLQNYSRHAEHKIERISKKYQWIGLHEYLGLLSDSLLFKEWNDNVRPLKGAWEIWKRNYDPSSAMYRRNHIDPTNEEAEEKQEFDNPLTMAVSNNQRAEWVASPFNSFEPYLTSATQADQWLTLYSHLNFKEPVGFGVSTDRIARKGQWIDIKAFLIPTAALDEVLSKLRNNSFYGDGLDLPEAHQCWVTEYPWHSSFEAVDEACLASTKWLRNQDLQVFAPVCRTHDDQHEDSITVTLPAPTLHTQMSELLGGLSIPHFADGQSISILDLANDVVFQGGVKKSKLLVNKVAMRKWLYAYRCTLIWCAISEKSAWDGRSHIGGISNQSAVYVLNPNGEIEGGMTETYAYEKPY